MINNPTNIAYSVSFFRLALFLPSDRFFAIMVYYQFNMQSQLHLSLINPEICKSWYQNQFLCYPQYSGSGSYREYWRRCQSQSVSVQHPAGKGKVPDNAVFHDGIIKGYVFADGHVRSDDAISQLTGFADVHRMIKIVFSNSGKLDTSPQSLAD